MEKKISNSPEDHQELSETPEIQIYVCSAGTIVSRPFRDLPENPEMRLNDHIQKSLL